MRFQRQRTQSNIVVKESIWSQISSVSTLVASIAAVFASVFAFHQINISQQSFEKLFEQVKYDKQIETCIVTNNSLNGFLDLTQGIELQLLYEGDRPRQSVEDHDLKQIVKEIAVSYQDLSGRLIASKMLLPLSLNLYAQSILSKASNIRFGALRAELIGSFAKGLRKDVEELAQEKLLFEKGCQRIIGKTGLSYL
jgi:hypothetical protein